MHETKETEAGNQPGRPVKMGARVWFIPPHDQKRIWNFYNTMKRATGTERQIELMLDMAFEAFDKNYPEVGRIEFEGLVSDIDILDRLCVVALGLKEESA